VLECIKCFISFHCFPSIGLILTLSFGLLTKEGDVLALKSSNMSYLAAVSPIRFYRNTFHNNSKKLDGLGISLMNFPEYMKVRRDLLE